MANLPITTPGIPTYQDRFLSDYLAPSRDVLGAMYGQAFTDNPSAQLQRMSDLDIAEHGVNPMASPDDLMQQGFPQPTPPESPLLSMDDAKKALDARGLQGQIDIPDTGIRQKSLDLLMEHRLQQNRRNAIMARSPGGFALNAAGITGQLAISALDPLNVATAFIPVVGPTRYARLLASAGESVLARTAVRAGVGAVEGVAGGLALEPLHMAAAKAYQDDYTMNDSLANIAFMGLFGAALHQLPAAASWASGKFRKGVPVEYQKAAFSEALSAFMEDRRPRVTEMMESLRREELMSGTSLGRAERFDPRLEPDVQLPEPEPGTVRLYHGGKDPTSGGGRWVSKYEDYARGYAKHNSGDASEVYYVDVPLDSPWLKKSEYFDEDGIIHNQEVPEEIAKQFRPVESKSAVPETRVDAIGVKVVNRDSGKTYTVDRLSDDGKRVILKEDGGKTAVTLGRDDFVKKVETPGGAWRSVSATKVRDAAPKSFDAAVAVTEPDPRNLTRVLTQIRDDRVNLPPDDARLATETDRMTPLYNKPETPEAAASELESYSLATDEAIETMRLSGRLSEEDMTLLDGAAQQITIAEQQGMGWKAAAACIARAFT